MKYIKFFSITFFATSFVALMLLMQTASAESSCNFTRDLELGDEGEDVRCLQKFLNSKGFKISNQGAGSPGKETDTFKDLTKLAIIKWQIANGLSPAEGYFGPMSRQTYKKISSAVTPVISSNSAITSILANSNPSPNDAAILKILESSLNTSNSSKTETVKTTPVTKTVSSKTAEELILKIISQIEDAEDEIDGSTVTASKLTSANNDIADAREYFMKAIKAYFNNDYTKAVNFGDDAFESAEDAYVNAGGKTRENEIDDLISEMEDKIDAIKDKIDTADDADKDVDESNKLITDAENLLKKAEDKYDDELYDEAEDLLNDTDDLADDAEDAIGEKSNEKKDAEDAIADAKDAIKDTRTSISDARDDDEDTDTAEDLLSTAEDYYDRARELFDDEEYESATTYAEKAEQKAEDAEDAL